MGFTLFFLFSLLKFKFSKTISCGYAQNIHDLNLVTNTNSLVFQIGSQSQERDLPSLFQTVLTQIILNSYIYHTIQHIRELIGLVSLAKKKKKFNNNNNNI